MDDKERFQKNVMRWSAFFPDAAMLFNSSFSTKIKEEMSLEEAECWKTSLDFTQFQVLYVYGLQKHVPYPVLKEWTQLDNHFLVILESDLSVVVSFLKTEEATELLENKNIWLYYLDPQYRILGQLAKIFVDLPYQVVSLYKDQDMNLPQIQSTLGFFYGFYRPIFGENAGFGASFLTNYFNNLFLWPKSAFGNGLFHQFHGVPAIICGAGPSLAKNIEVLKTLKDRALIFGGGSSMNALNEAGMTPHLGVGIDPNRDHLTRIIMNNAFEVPFLYRGRMYHEALELVRGDKLYITGSSGYKIADYFEEACGIPQEDIDEGYNVINFNLGIAVAMGCNPIIFVGVDLAYSAKQAYAPGMISHPLHRKFRTKSHQEEIIYRKDIHGDVVPTLWKWLTESLWFSDFAEKNPGFQLINSTEGGIGFSGIPNISLAEAAKTYLSKSQDIETRLLGEIQRNRLPSSITFDRIVQLFQDLIDNFTKVQTILSERLKELMDLQQKEEESPLSFSSFKEALYQELKLRFQDELSYKYFLSSFDESFDFLKGREYARLALDYNLLPVKKWQQFLINLEIERVHFLFKSILFNENLMQKILSEQMEKRAIEEKKISFAPSPKQESLYCYENHWLTILDLECGLNVSEEFIPDPVSGISRLYDTEGKLKFESYYKGATLHGPTRFYASDGRILVESWFLNGLQEGKRISYFSAGNMHFIQRYKHGVKCGKQEYYNEEGALLSLLLYSENGLSS